METKQVKVAAYITAPRYEAVWARNMIDAALNENRIPVNVSGGVFYGQCMQNMLEKAIDIGVEIAVTVDFDSIITAENVRQLLQTITAHPEIDALAALQCRRGQPYPLFTKGAADHVEMDGTPLQVKTAHFGLTAIRLERLKDVPKPWFWSKPDDNGSWGKGHIDDDIWFWRQWMDADRTVYVDPLCSIGHLEEMVAMFDDTGKHCWMYPNDWSTKFKPEAVK